jgi:hypothetical protein
MQQTPTSQYVSYAELEALAHQLLERAVHRGELKSTEEIESVRAATNAILGIEIFLKMVEWSTNFRHYVDR